MRRGIKLVMALGAVAALGLSAMPASAQTTIQMYGLQFVPRVATVDFSHDVTWMNTEPVDYDHYIPGVTGDHDVSGDSVTAGLLGISSLDVYSGMMEPGDPDGYVCAGPGDGSGPAKCLKDPEADPNDPASYFLLERGVYAYQCSIHTTIMKGILIVK